MCTYHVKGDLLLADNGYPEVVESQRVVEGRGVIRVQTKEEEAWEHQITVLAWVVEDLLTAEATCVWCGVVFVHTYVCMYVCVL